MTAAVPKGNLFEENQHQLIKKFLKMLKKGKKKRTRKEKCKISMNLINFILKKTFRLSFSLSAIFHHSHPLYRVVTVTT